MIHILPSSLSNMLLWFESRTQSPYIECLLNSWSVFGKATNLLCWACNIIDLLYNLWPGGALYFFRPRTSNPAPLDNNRLEIVQSTTEITFIWSRAVVVPFSLKYHWATPVSTRPTPNVLLPLAVKVDIWRVHHQHGEQSGQILGEGEGGETEGEGWERTTGKL